MAVAKVDLSKFRGYPKRFEASVFREVKKQLATTFHRFHREHAKRRMSGPNTSAGTLRRRTGALARSFDFIVRGNSLDDLRAFGFSDVLYAPVHEHGATIRAKRATWLTFPVAFSGAFGKPTAWRRAVEVTIPSRLNYAKDFQKRKPTTAAEIREAVRRGIENA